MNPCHGALRKAGEFLAIANQFKQDPSVHRAEIAKKGSLKLLNSWAQVFDILREHDLRIDLLSKL